MTNTGSNKISVVKYDLRRKEIVPLLKHCINIPIPKHDTEMRKYSTSQVPVWIYLATLENVDVFEARQSRS